MKVDTSQLAIGAVLLLESDDLNNEEVLFRKKHVPICYFSEKLTESKKGRSAIYLELYGIKKALIFFAPLIMQDSLDVFSDHKPLCKVMESDVTPRYVDLIDAISSYSIRINYINGKCNVLADLLSRLFNNFKNSFVESENLSKSAKVAQELFTKFYKNQSHMCYAKMKESVIEEFQKKNFLNI
uniref:RT_RNaseH domain-containing protein n=1 Tax=Strongyloides stercoralis TaxID=6248 RepID=A0A0K0E216_STRER